MEGFLNFQSEVSVWERNLPHWDGATVWTFATWRLADSLPRGKLAEWVERRDVWLACHPHPWSEEIRREYDERFTERMDEWLDAGEGSCILRDETLKGMVTGALRHFMENGRPARLAPETGGDARSPQPRYALHAYAVMPNHVHVMFRPLPKQGIAKIDPKLEELHRTCH